MRGGGEWRGGIQPPVPGQGAGSTTEGPDS